MSNNIHEVKIVESPEKPDESPAFQLKINIHNSGGFTFIQFNRPMQNLKMTKKDAREFARRIMMEALK